MAFIYKYAIHSFIYVVLICTYGINFYIRCLFVHMIFICTYNVHLYIL